MDNVAQTTKTADRDRMRSEPNLDPSKNKVNNPATVTESIPPQDDAAAQNERRELIKENRELLKRLERADRATQGLQQGYEEMDEREKAATQDLKLKENELADCRELEGPGRSPGH